MSEAQRRREIERCRENIERCRSHVMTGRAPEGWQNPVQFTSSFVADFEGALQGLTDWIAELALLEAEAAAAAPGAP